MPLLCSTSPEKSSKANQVRLRLILKNLKNSEPIKMDAIRRRTWKSRSVNTVCHLDFTRKLVKHKFVVSSAVDGFSRCVMWIKCYNNNRGNTAHDLHKGAVNKNITPLQVRGGKGLENRLIAKYVVIVCNVWHRGCIGGKSTQKTRIDRFWRKHNDNVMIRFRDMFERLESLGCLDTDSITDLWSLHYACVGVINQKTHDFKEHHN